MNNRHGSTALQTDSSINTLSGPYSALYEGGRKIISYAGNQVFSPIANIRSHSFENATRDQTVRLITQDKKWKHIQKIDNALFFSAVNYFKNRGSEWCNLPLTTLMISSPGEVYSGKTLDYTTDTLPIDISWFDADRSIFLAESSQFYLELRLLLDDVNEVFSIYNSFRKEPADFSHLSEFQHIEFEGHISPNENIKIAQDLVQVMIKDALQNSGVSLMYFLGEKGIEALERSAESDMFTTISFRDALSLLRKDTGDSRYKKFSLEHFGSWEEVRLTEILGKHVWVTEFPLLQIPFYHNDARRDIDGVPIAENADLIMAGYREIVGAGARISSTEMLMKKAEIFNLPKNDYLPYLSTRDLEYYQPTAGFGLGWQRLTHWMLKLPAIWDTTPTPRGHTIPAI